MIHTVTLNPALDITYEVQRVRTGEPLEALRVEKTPGGKGINVSRALRAMGVDSVAMTLVGGHIGEELLDLLEDEGLILQVVKTADETRANVTILGKEDSTELSVRSPGPCVDETVVLRVSELLFDSCEPPEMLVLSGSIPIGASDDVYKCLIERGRELGVKTVLDSKGEPFRLGIEAGPDLVKPNIVELEELAGRELASESDIVAFSSEILDAGVCAVAVSLGRSGAVLVTREGVWKGVVPAIDGDTVGAGDSMVAGMVKEIESGRPLDEAFRTGIAFGVSTVMNEGPGLLSPDTYREALNMIKVQKVS